MKLAFEKGTAFWKSDAFFRFVAQSSSQGIVATDADYHYVFINDAMARIYGVPASELLGTSALERAASGSRERMHELIRRRRAGVAEKYEFPIQRPDGEVRWVLFDSTPIVDDDGIFRGTLANASDITERKQMEDALREREKQLSAAEQIARLGSWSWNVNGNDVKWSDELYRIYGLRPQSERMTLERYLSLVHPDDRERVQRHVQTALETRAPFQFSERILCPDGSTRHLVSRGRVICHADGSLREVVGICMDVTERREGEARLQQLLHYDALTGLPNRQVLRRRVDECLARANRYRRNGALLLIDPDQFAAVNESLGSEAGDRIIAELAQRLAGAVSETDFLASLGGDKFAVLLEELADTGEAAFTANRLATEIGRPLAIDGQVFQITASIGIAMFPGDGEDADTVLRHAGSALRSSKRSGPGRHHFYARNMTAEAEQLLRIAHGLESALQNDEFFVVYEPRADILTRRTVAAQALLRWQPPGERVRKPEHFLRAAEETGKASEIDRWMISTACRDLARWRKAGLRAPARLSIALCSAQVLEEDFAAFVLQTLDANRLAPSDIEIEISERLMLANFQSITHALRPLIDRDVSLALADIGTGETRCLHILDLPIGTLRISRGFVEALGVNVKSDIFVEAIPLIGRRMGASIYAEGVETERQAATLRANGCQFMQGRLVSQPLPAFAMKEFLQEAAEIA